MSAEDVSWGEDTSKAETPDLADTAAVPPTELSPGEANHWGSPSVSQPPPEPEPRTLLESGFITAEEEEAEGWNTSNTADEEARLADEAKFSDSDIPPASLPSESALSTDTQTLENDVPSKSAVETTNVELVDDVPMDPPSESAAESSSTAVFQPLADDQNIPSTEIVEEVVAPPIAKPATDASETAAFVPLLAPPPTTTTLTVDSEDDFSDFDDFAPAPTSLPAPPAPILPPPTESHAEEEEDDDFGDFDDFAAPPEPAPASAPAPTPQQPAPTISLEPERDADEEFRIETLLQTVISSQSLLAELNQSLARAFPAAPLPNAQLNTKPVESILGEAEASQGDPTQPDGKSTKLTVPNVAYAENDWYKLYQKMSSDTVYAEGGTLKFTWRRSLIRKAYLKSLDVAIDVDEMFKQPQTPAILPRTNPIASATASGADTQNPNARASTTTGGGGGPPDDEKEADLFEAKRLCDITEEEMRRKSTAELQSLISDLQRAQQRMQEQANEWLDAKERLVMDAEMHNKMIASLVQYAQQQQVGPKGEF
ncbi:hypothetical protein HDV00_008172 [Rhizophlyctis rosea]|nr:hypothetical protein HDV00_008172 [Rhizophlyctis rosea]